MVKINSELKISKQRTKAKTLSGQELQARAFKQIIWKETSTTVKMGRYSVRALSPQGTLLCHGKGHLSQRTAGHIVSKPENKVEVLDLLAKEILVS